MPRETILPGSFHDWIRHAKSDLDLSDIEKPECVLWENLCFHAQQAAEKSLKALLIFKNIEIPRTHNLRILLDLIPADMNVPEDVEDAAILSDYAVTSRYPGDYPAVTQTEYEEAIQLAKTVYEWVIRVCESPR